MYVTAQNMSDHNLHNMSCHLHSKNHEANNSLITKELETVLKIKNCFALLHKT